MQSKTSCFNVGIFKNNIKRFWPVAAIIFLAFFSALPFSFYTSWTYRSSYAIEDVNNLLYFVPSELSCLNFPALIFVFSAIAVFGVFGYLFNTRSSYMMCAFPVERKTWIFTNVISILVLEIVPVILSIIIAMIFCAANGLGNVLYLFFFLAQNLCYFLIFNGIAMVCVFVSGNYLGAIGSYVVVNFLSYMVVSFIYSIQHVFLLGYSPDNIETITRENVLSPCLYLSCGNIRIDLNYAGNSSIPTVSFEGIPALIIYSLVGIALMAACLFIAKVRRTETAGELISFGWLKKVFQIIVAAFVSVFISEMIVSSFRENFVISYSEAFVCMIFCSIVIGAICHYAFEMFARKTIKVFNLKQFKNFAFYSLGIIVIMTVVKCDPTGFENKTYNPEEIEWAGINYDGCFTYTTEKSQEIIDIQKLFLENKSTLKNLKRTNDDYTQSVNFKYKMKDGRNVYRCYYITDEKECEEVYNKMLAILRKPDYMKEALINPNWEDAVAVGVELYNEIPINGIEGDEWESQWEDLKLPQDEIEELYQAVLKDIDEGNMTPLYNIDYEKLYVMELNFNLKSSNFEKTCGEVFNEYTNEYYREGNVRDIYFSASLEPAMKNTIQKMIDIGIIQSEDELVLKGELF